MTHTKDWLANLKVAAPCREDWGGMTGDERSRVCAKCELRVWNLTAMTRAEAEALVGGATGRVCVKFLRRADGTVITSDCPVGVTARRRRVAAFSATFAAGIGAIAAFGAGLMGRRGTGTGEVPGVLKPIVDLFTPELEPPPEPVMGSVAYPGPMPEPDAPLAPDGAEE